jgi:hypothetical protein
MDERDSKEGVIAKVVSQPSETFTVSSCVEEGAGISVALDNLRVVFIGWSPRKFHSPLP